MNAHSADPTSSGRGVDAAGLDYVLPAPPRSLRVPLTPPRAGATAGAAERGGGVAAAIGGRLLVQVESLAGLLTEVQDKLQRLDAAIAEDSRAQLKGGVRQVGEVVEWCAALQQSLAVEAARAAAGEEPVDLSALCQQVVAAGEAAEPIHVIATRPVVCWAQRAPMRRLLEAALALVAARTGGRGLRCLEIDWRDDVPVLRVRSQGEPGGELAPEVVATFRDAVERAGAQVVPDEHGPGGAGLVLRFPASAAATAP